MESDPSRSVSRPLVESLAVLLIGMLLLRTFTAEAYIVPTGSMAPTLLGVHREVICSECQFRFALGVDEEGHAGRPLCPNCGADASRSRATERSGDRLLVHKFLYDWRSPRRWEVVVFQNPSAAGQAYVKRLVGLPGESIEIDDGDVLIDGKIARKSLAEQRAMRILVHDSVYRSANDPWQSRWVPLQEDGGASGWIRRADGSFLLQHSLNPVSDLADLVHYRHLDPDRGDVGPVRDFVAYNGADMSSQELVGDLLLDALVTPYPTTRDVVVRIRDGRSSYRVRIPLRPDRPCEVWRNGERIELTDALTAVERFPAGRACRLEVSLFDARLTVALDGRLLFAPVDEDFSRSRPGQGRWSSRNESPVSIGLVGGGGEIQRLRVYRDVYYTDGLSISPRRPFAVGTPYQLGEGEYFVLGDNSPVSNDSRFWTETPVVRRESLLGKPFLVHLPSQGVPLRVFGQELYWVPDLREIRYIR